jgi:hypothetical protein
VSAWESDWVRGDGAWNGDGLGRTGGGGQQEQKGSLHRRGGPPGPENPYDISSFYRSSQGGYGFYGPIDLLRQPPTPYGGRYPIAGFYRSRQGYYFGLQTPVSQNPYAIASYYRSNASTDVRFWYGGYGRAVPAGRTRGYNQYWNSIGENGDLFLMAPTFLAPVGALSAVYYSGR